MLVIVFGGDGVMDWQTLIGNYAFPIACCLYLFWSQEKERERHKEESDKWVEALNNNTKVIEALKERLNYAKE